MVESTNNYVPRYLNGKLEIDDDDGSISGLYPSIFWDW
jgi:hypothetical protein